MNGEHISTESVPGGTQANSDLMQDDASAQGPRTRLVSREVDGTDLGTIVMSLMRKGQLDPSEVDADPMTSRYYFDRKSGTRQVTIESVGIDVGFVPGDPAVVVRSFIREKDGSERQLPITEFIEPHLVDEYVKMVLEMRDEAAKHKDDVIPVRHRDAAPDDENDRLIDEADDNEVYVVSTFVVRICSKHDLVELTLHVEDEAGTDVPRVAVALRPEHIHSLARALEAARDDSGRGKHTIVGGSRVFE